MEPVRIEDEGPPGHRAAVARARRWAIGIAAATAAASAATLARALVWNGPAWPAATALALFLFLGLVGWWNWRETSRHYRVIPYFERRVGNTRTFLRGRALARRWGRLEALARAEGVAPLSTFGFADDLRGGPVDWRPAAEGARTIRGLLRGLESNPIGSTPEELAELREDLEAIAEALDRAAASGVGFAFLLQHANATSGHEWASRRGTPF